MSAPRTGSHIPPVRFAAMSAVRVAAVGRIGDQPGFDCLLGFMSWEKAGQADPGLCWSLFLEPMELMQRFTARHEAPDARRSLVLYLLGLGMQASDPEAAALASRISMRMLARRADGAAPFPLLIVEAIEDGVAGVIAIHDKFWTGNWDQWESPSSSL